jgi:hypothetical protein
MPDENALIDEIDEDEEVLTDHHKSQIAAFRRAEKLRFSDIGTTGTNRKRLPDLRQPFFLPSRVRYSSA